MPFSHSPRTFFMILVASSACAISVQVQNVREENYPLAFSRRIGENEIVDPSIPHGDAVPWDEFVRRNRFNTNTPAIVQQYRNPSQHPSGPPARDPPGRDGNLSNDWADVANPAPHIGLAINWMNYDNSNSAEQSSEHSSDDSSSSSSLHGDSTSAVISAPVVPINPHAANEDRRRTRVWTRVRSAFNTSNSRLQSQQQNSVERQNRRDRISRRYAINEDRRRNRAWNRAGFVSSDSLSIRSEAQQQGPAEPRRTRNRLSQLFSFRLFDRNGRGGSATTQNSAVSQPTPTAISRP